jgi:hypothetical protein
MSAYFLLGHACDHSLFLHPGSNPLPQHKIKQGKTQYDRGVARVLSCKSKLHSSTASDLSARRPGELASRGRESITTGQGHEQQGGVGDLVGGERMKHRRRSAALAYLKTRRRRSAASRGDVILILCLSSDRRRSRLG